MFMFLAFLFACSESNRQPTSPEACEKMGMGAQKDDCWSEHAITIFHQDESRGVALVETQITDQRIADYIWLTVTRDYNPSSKVYCNKIADSALKKRCLVLVNRPHLHRDILRTE